MGKYQGPAQAIERISNDALKLLRRGVNMGLKPTYQHEGITIEQVEAEFKRRGLPLKRLGE